MPLFYATDDKIDNISSGFGILGFRFRRNRNSAKNHCGSGCPQALQTRSSGHTVFLSH